MLAASFIITLEFQPQTLTGLALVSTVPTRTAGPPTDAATSSQHQAKTNVLEKGKMALVATFVDFHDCTFHFFFPSDAANHSTPCRYQTSNVIPQFLCNPYPAKQRKSPDYGKISVLLDNTFLIFASQTIAPPITRTIDQGVITHMEPFTDLHGPMIYVCILDVSGVYNVAKSSPHQATIGTIQVLQL